LSKRTPREGMPTRIKGAKTLKLVRCVRTFSQKQGRGAGATRVGGRGVGLCDTPKPKCGRWAALPTTQKLPEPQVLEGSVVSSRSNRDACHDPLVSVGLTTKLKELVAEFCIRSNLTTDTHTTELEAEGRGSQNDGQKRKYSWSPSSMAPPGMSADGGNLERMKARTVHGPTAIVRIEKKGSSAGAR